MICEPIGTFTDTCFSNVWVVASEPSFSFAFSATSSDVAIATSVSGLMSFPMSAPARSDELIPVGLMNTVAVAV